MITSRELLRIDGEVAYPVPPLAERDAVALFCERSRLEPDETIATLCRRLDDLPLAIELAAARTSVLSPVQILERLSQRLDLLRGGRDADPRQQTLRATIEWSHHLLDPVEQRLFGQLAVFRGGATLETAEQVASADLDTLHSRFVALANAFPSTPASAWRCERTKRTCAGGTPDACSRSRSVQTTR